MTSKRGLAVVAIGGNSLIKDKDHKTVPDQYAAAQETGVHIAGMIEQGWDVAIGHGNGPQVGFILRRSELSRHELHEVPLDFCGADSQGAIGYMLQQILHNEFRRRGLDKQAVTVVTQVLVDREDPAFRNPTKPIGSFMSQEEASQRRDVEGWDVVEDAGRGWRRVVPSPFPQEVVERDAVKELLDKGFVVITVGGGGIPVIEDEEGNLVGTAAVIDKDYASALLAQRIGADLFLISTAVEKVALNFGKPDQQDIDVMTVDEAKRYMAEGHFAPGSMKPKIQAIIWFLEGGGKASSGDRTSPRGRRASSGDRASLKGRREAIITNPENIERALAGETGTRIIP